MLKKDKQNQNQQATGAGKVQSVKIALLNLLRVGLKRFVKAPRDVLKIKSLKIKSLKIKSLKNKEPKRG